MPCNEQGIYSLIRSFRTLTLNVSTGSYHISGQPVSRYSYHEKNKQQQQWNKQQNNNNKNPSLHPIYISPLLTWSHFPLSYHKRHYQKVCHLLFFSIKISSEKILVSLCNAVWHLTYTPKCLLFHFIWNTDNQNYCTCDFWNLEIFQSTRQHLEIILTMKSAIKSCSWT